MPASVPSRTLLVRSRTRITMLTVLALLLVAWFFNPRVLPWPWLGAGTFLVVLGIAVRVWAAGFLRKEQELICWGPFAHLRNPLYLGTFLIGIGFCFLSGRWESFVLAAVVMTAVYLPTIKFEERVLHGLFGDIFQEYCQNVPRLIPRLSPYRAGVPSGRQFQWSQVLANQEQSYVIVQVIILAAFYGIYLLKMLHVGH